MADSMKTPRRIISLCALLALPLVLAACGGGIPGNSVADMAGNPITTAAFKHWMYVAAKGNAAQSPGAPVIVPTDPPNFDQCVAQVRKQIPSLAKQKTKQLRTDCNQLFTSLSGQVMDFLIRAYWYQADAAKQKIKVTDAQVQSAFQKAKKQQFPNASQFNAFLSETGQTLPDILFRVRVNQIYMKLLAKHHTAITPASIQAYYNAHTAQFGTQETRNLRLVRTNKQAQAQAAVSALRSGQSWKTVAKKYSVDTATKSNGGVLVGVTKGEEEQALDKVAFSAPINKIMGPIHGQFGWYVVEVTSVKAATHQTLAQATPLIRQILTAQSQTTAQTAVDNTARKHWKAKTKCRPLFSMADCAGYKAPKTTTTGVPGTSTGG
jgi:parvulin-like peptidyl-prolyl isomerase